MASRTEMLRFIQNIKAMFPRFVESEEVISAWHRQFATAPLSALQKAFDQYLQDGKYAPTLSDIFQIVRRIGGGRRPDETPFSREQLADYRKCQEANGLVEAFAEGKSIGAVRKDLCILRGGRWQKKIDYCLEILGGAKVTEILKGEVGSEVFNPGKPFPQAKYKEVLEQLVYFADSQQGGKNEKQPDLF